MNFLKNKKVILVVSAIVFLVVIFFIKNKPVLKSQEGGNANLAYSNETIEDLVGKDTDLDGVADWEEALWGTDPKKKDTNNDGVSDSVEIAGRKPKETERAKVAEKVENLSETDKLSRELFSTIAALNQAGPADQATIDALGNSLFEQMRNSPVQKVFTVSQIKTNSNENGQSIQNYANILTAIFTKYAIKENITGILSESLTSDGDIDVKTLDKLDPVIKKIKSIVNEMSKVAVPQSLVSAHLETMNGFERLLENLSDIKLVDKDIVVVMGAVSEYEKNDEKLRLALDKLTTAINKKLGE